jgi:hypothetical protein
MIKHVLGQQSKLLILFLVTLLAGCNNLNQAATQFDQKVIAWKSLAASSTSALKQHGLRISASPIWQETTLGKKYMLTDFSFTAPIDDYRLNLVTPSFSNKYICHWYCELLNEVRVDKIPGNFTYLTKLYNANEAELVNFYSQLIMIEEFIYTTKLTDQALALKFDQLTLINAKFQSLPALIDHLKNFLNTEQSIFQQIALEQKKESTPSNNKVINADLPPTAPASTADLITVQTDQVNDLVPDLPKISLNQLVCSYQSNYFGRTVEQADDKVAISLIGQAKKELNGQTINLPPNTLYAAPGQFQYVELDGIKIFDRSDIIACNILFNNE